METTINTFEILKLNEIKQKKKIRLYNYSENECIHFYTKIQNTSYELCNFCKKMRKITLNYDSSYKKYIFKYYNRNDSFNPLDVEQFKFFKPLGAKTEKKALENVKMLLKISNHNSIVVGEYYTNLSPKNNIKNFNEKYIRFNKLKK